AGRSDPVGDPSADSGGVAVAGTAGGARKDRAIRSTRTVLSLAARGSGGGPVMRRDPGEDQTGRTSTAGSRRDIPEDLGPRGRGRVSRRRAGGSGDDSVSDGALVLLSGAYGRAVSSCVMLT